MTNLIYVAIPSCSTFSHGYKLFLFIINYWAQLIKLYLLSYVLFLCENTIDLFFDWKGLKYLQIINRYQNFRKKWTILLMFCNKVTTYRKNCNSATKSCSNLSRLTEGSRKAFRKHSICTYYRKELPSLMKN